MIRDEFDLACMRFASGCDESAIQIARRFGVSRQYVYKKAEDFELLYGLKKRPDGRRRPKIEFAGLLNQDDACP
jgi:Zn-dependent peptidase ImmA (M78 family)